MVGLKTEPLNFFKTLSLLAKFTNQKIVMNKPLAKYKIERFSIYLPKFGRTITFLIAILLIV